MLSPALSLLIWVSDKIKTGQLLLSDAADPLAFSSSDKGDRLRIYCLQRVALYTTENLSWHSSLCPCFRVLSKWFSGNVLSHWAVCLSLTSVHVIPCRKSSPEEGAGSFSRVLITNASSDGIFFVGCTMLFIKAWPQPHKNMNCTMAEQGKSLILTFPRFSCSRIIRVYCSLKET